MKINKSLTEKNTEEVVKQNKRHTVQGFRNKNNLYMLRKRRP